MNQPRNNNVLIVAATVVVVVVIGAITSVALAIEDGARATSMIALIVGPVTSLFGFLVLIARLESVKGDMTEVKQHAEQLANGGGDAKMRAAVAEVLRPDLVDPNAQAQLEVDRTRREAARDAGTVLLERAHDPSHRKDTP